MISFYQTIVRCLYSICSSTVDKDTDLPLQVWIRKVHEDAYIMSQEVKVIWTLVSGFFLIFTIKREY